MDLTGLRVFNTARVYGSAALAIAPPSAPWQVRASTNFIAQYSPFDEPGVVAPGYALVHVSATYRVGGSTFQFAVRNLLDAKYTELRAGGVVAPGQPMSIYGGWRVGI